MNITKEKIVSAIDENEMFLFIARNNCPLGDSLPQLCTKMRFHNFMIELINKKFNYDVRENRTIDIDGVTYRYLDFLKFNYSVLKHFLDKYVELKIMQSLKMQGKHGIGYVEQYVLTAKGNEWIRNNK